MLRHKARDIVGAAQQLDVGMAADRIGEPFHTTETMRVDDVVALDVATF